MIFSFYHKKGAQSSIQCAYFEEKFVSKSGRIEMELSEDPSILLCNQTKSSNLSDQQDSRGQKGGGGLLVEPRPFRGVRLHLDSASGS